MWAVGEEALGEHNPASEMHVQGETSRSGSFCRGSRAGCYKS